MQFPVSSGQHHRLNESEWVPVVASKKPPAAAIKGNLLVVDNSMINEGFFVFLAAPPKSDLTSSFRAASTAAASAAPAAPVPPPVMVPPPQPPPGTMQQYTADPPVAVQQFGATVGNYGGIPALMAAPVNPPSQYLVEPQSQSIFQDTSQGSVSIDGRMLLALSLTLFIM